MASITFRIPENLRAEIERAAAADGRSVSDYVRRFFAQKLSRSTTRRKKGSSNQSPA